MLRVTNGLRSNIQCRTLQLLHFGIDSGTRGGEGRGSRSVSALGCHEYSIGLQGGQLMEPQQMGNSANQLMCSLPEIIWQLLERIIS